MYNDHLFQIDFRKWLMLNLPTMLRKTLFVHLLWCLLYPFWTLYKQFYQRRTENLFYAKFDSGKGNIERMLNVLFDGEEKRIYISNVPVTEVEYEKTYLNDEMEDDSTYVSEYIDENNSYIDAEKMPVAFRVYILSTLEDDVENIRNKVQMYVLPSIKFEIKYIES